MYDINLSFLHCKELDTSINELQNHYDLCYKNIIANSILNCKSCNTFADSEQVNNNKNLVEVRCYGLINHFFCEVNEEFSETLSKNDYVIISADDNLEIAIIKEIGNIVKVKYKKFELSAVELPKLVRKADEEDLKHFHQNMIDESKSKVIFKEKIQRHKLEMKLVDIHYQFDRKKLFFFYTADGRVDFRELAKDLASVFKTRIELRQIGVRDETKRVGGLGSCGREYCCSSFLNNFKKISTQFATETNPSSNLSKLSGPCGKLKCCLSFES